jgi:predicted O-methyltransferase YrrM
MQPSTSSLMTNQLPDSLTSYIDTYMPRMDGWCNADKARALARAVISTDARVALEIGVYAGRSLIAIALAQQALSNDRTVYGIDPWSNAASTAGWDDANGAWWSGVDHDDIYRKAQSHLVATGTDSTALLIRATSDCIASLITAPCPAPFLDLLHIDGNHSAAQSQRDVACFAPLVRPGGIICFDDTNWESTKAAQQLLLNYCTFTHFVEVPGQQCGFYLRK